MMIDFYSDLKRAAYELDIELNNPTIVKSGDIEVGDFKITALTGRIPLPVNILTLKYEKGALRSVTRDIKITKKRDEMTGLYYVETYTREWRLK